MNKVCLSVVMVLIRALTVRGFSGITVATTFLFSQKRAHCHSNLKLKAASTLNPLSIKDNLPLFEELKSVDVLPVIEEDLIFLSEGFKKLESDLANPKEVSYEEVVENLEKIQHPIGYSWGVVNHLLGVKNSDELRKSHETIQPKVIETYQKLGQSQPYFQALKKLKEKTLDEAQSRVVASAIRSMESSGVGLQESDRLIFNKLQLEAAELSTKFSNNLLDSTKAFKLLVESKDDIEGLPASALGLAAQQAKANGHPDATPENGPWLLTLDMPCYLPCMQNLKNRNIREQLYRAYATRASSGELDNSPIIKRTLQIKYEMAKMLNYESHAHKSLAAKMAPSVESVIELNRMLLEKAYPAAVKELEELQSFAEKEYGFTEKLNLWDVPYFSERLREKSYEFQEEELRPYFALPNVLDGLFALAERLFDVKIVAADGTTQVWHPDVRFFNIIDKKSDERIASFFLDPYSRPEEKRGGAWMDVCVGKSRALGKLPVAYLICNGSPPVGDKPSLMTFREVETLFHEFGHGLQHMLTRVSYGDAAGINNVEWDAVELPSQFMENWCYDKPTIDGFAKHYLTNEPLPQELFNKVKAAKNFQAGLFLIRQLFFGITDMKLHSPSYDPYGEKSPFDVMSELAKEYTVVPPLPDDRFLCGFGHIFAGGYSAGYYSYIWAEVMSADAFAAFEEVGLENEEKVRETGKRFRETVLALGGSKHPSDVFKAFRGRDPSPEALLRHRGLA